MDQVIGNGAGNVNPSIKGFSVTLPQTTSAKFQTVTGTRCSKAGR